MVIILLMTLYALTGTANGLLVADSIVIAATSVQPSCYGTSNGSIDISISGGTSPYSYAWSTGDTSEDISNLPAGQYTITVMDSGGGNAGTFDWSYINTGTNHTIMVPAGTVTIDGLPISAGDYVGVFYNTPNGLHCGGYKQWTGAATAIPAWGTESGNNNGFANGEAFTWKVWRLTEGIAIDMNAIYELGVFADTVFTPNGMCIMNTLSGNSPTGNGLLSSVLEINLSAPAQINISATLSDYSGYAISANGASDGSIDLSISGGNSPYTFSWSEGESTEDLSGLSAGPYNVSVTDASSCSANSGFVLDEPEIIVPPAILSSVLSNISCNGTCDGNIDLSLTGGSPPFSFDWSNGSNSEDISGLCAGTYHVTVSFNTGPAGSNPFNWTFTNTGSNHIILLQAGSININSTSIQPGDFVGIFYDSLGTLACGGYKLWTGNTTAITAWGSQPGQNDGFANGEAFTWKVYKASEQIIVDMVPVFLGGFLHTGNYVDNGLSGIETLTGSYVTLSQTTILMESFTLTEPNEMQLTLTGLNSCAMSGTLGSVNLEVAGGTPTYSYLWSNGATSQDTDSLMAGSYSVTVTDMNNCVATGSVVVEQISPIQISYLMSDYSGYQVSANGASDGWIDVSASGGSGSYTFAWGGGGSTEDLSNLAAGLYLLTVNDTNNCPATATITLTEPPPPPASLSAIKTQADVSCYGVCDGQINITVSNGTPPYSFLWSDNSTLEDRNGLCAGAYSVTISDSGTGGNVPAAFNWNYINTGINHSILIPQGVPMINGTPLQSGDYIGVFFTNGGTQTCAGYQQWTGTTTALTAWGTQVGGLKNGFDIGEGFQWKVWRSSDQMTVDMMPTYQSSFANAGTYINNGLSGLASLSGYMPLGNQQNQQIIVSTIISQPAEILVQASVTNVLCNGASTGNIDINIGNGVQPLYYTWSNNTFLQDLSNIQAGLYSVLVSDATGCSASGQFEVTENTDLEITSVVPSINGYEISAWGATDGSIDISVNGGASPYSYTWSSGESSQDLSNLTAGSYQLTIVDNAGCSAMASFVLTQPAIQSNPLTLTSNITDASCLGVCSGSISLSVSGGTSPYEYFWSNGSTGAFLSNLCAGTYAVTITDSGNTYKSFTGFTWSYINTGVNHTILLPAESVFVDGVAIASGDYVGVFYNSGGGIMCGGYKQWDGNTTAISAWGAQSGSNDGFALGEAFQWRVWRQSDSAEIAMTPIYNSSFANEQFYTSNGMSGILNLSGSALSSMGGKILFDSFIINEPASLAVNGTASNISCSGLSNGAIDITVIGGSSPYTFNWTNSATTEDLTSLAAGPYAVTVTDTNGCSASAGFILSQTSPLSVGLSGSDVSCFGENDGSASTLISGGTYPFTFVWSNGATSSTLTNLIAGSYCVTVTDFNSCEASACLTVVQPDEIILNLTAADPLCYGDEDGSIQTVVNGGIVPLSFAWSNGATLANLNNLSAGTYDLSLTDANSCLQTAAAIIVEPAQLGYNAVVSNFGGYSVSAYGASDGSINLSAAGGVQPYTFIWSNGSTLEDASNLSAGTYQLTITDNNACIVNASFTLNEPPPTNPLTAIYSTVDISCYGICDGSIELSVSGGVSPYTYEWSNGATDFLLDQLCGGNYSVTIFDSNIATPEPETFSWSFSNTGVNHSILIPNNSITIDGLAIQTGDVVGVFYTDNNSLSCGGYIVWPGQMTALTAWGSQPGFEDGFAAGEAFTWKVWRASDSIVVDMTAVYDPNFPFANLGLFVSNGMSGISSLTGTMPFGNQSDSIVFAFELTEPAEILLNSNLAEPSCYGASNGQIEALVSNGNSPYLYNWANGASSNLLSGLSAGNYILSLTDQDGCQATASFGLNQPDEILLSSQSGNVSCNGGNNGWIEVATTGGTTPYSFAWSNGETGEDIDNLQAAFYTLTVSDQNNCLATIGVEITEPVTLQFSASPYNPLCYGESNGMIAALPFGGTDPISMLWSNGSTDVQNDNLMAGNYCVTATDANGCQASACWELENPDQTVVDLLPTPVSCNGAADGTITTTVTSGSVYIYSWSNGAETANLSNLSAGIYILTAYDPQDCMSYDTIEVTEPDVLSVSFNQNNVSAFGLNDGAIDLSVSGGVSPYAFSWSNNVSGEDQTNLAAGIYSVNISDANGCEIIETIEICQPLGTSFSLDGLNCYGDCNAEINLTSGGGISPYFYSWDNGASTESLSGLCAGTYELTIYDSNVASPEAFDWTFTNTGANHAIAIPFGTVLVDGQPLSNGDVLGVFYHQGTELACGGYQVYTGATTGLTAWGAQSGQDDGFELGETFIWKVWRSVDSSIVDLTAAYSSMLPQQGNYVNNGMSGIESLIGTSSTIEFGDSVVYSFNISQPDLLALSGIETNVSCNGLANGAIDLSISGGTMPFDITWSNNETTEDIDNLAAGTYSVSVEDANGCTTDASFNLSEPDLLVLSGLESNVTCNGLANGAIDLSISGGTLPFDISWSNNEITEDLDNLAAGTYSVTVEGANGCTADASFNLSEPDLLALSGLESNVTCNGLENGAIDLSISGGTSPFYITWSNNEITEDLDNLAAGTYSVTVEDANGCTTDASFNLSEPDLLVLSGLESNVTCNGLANGAIDLSISGGTLPFEITWSNNETTEDIDNLSTGTYSVTVEDANGCTVDASFTITQPDVLTIAGTETNVSCNGLANGAIDLSISGGTLPLDITWSNNEITEDIDNLWAGTYSVTLEDGNGCTADASFTLTQPDLLDVSYTSTNANCYGQSNGNINITASGGMPGYSYLWGNGATSEDRASIPAGTYTLTVSDANNCLATLTIVVSQPDVVSYAAQVTNVSCNGANDGAVSLDVYGGTSPYTYLWLVNATTSGINNLGAGSYSVLITDNHNCLLTAGFTVTQPNALTLSLSADDVSCFDGSSGTITSVVTGGTGILSYLWSNGETTENLANVSAGSYSLTISDANACSMDASITVNEPQAIEIQVSSTNPLCHGDQNGSAGLSVSGGVSPYSILWSNAETDALIEGLAAGEYCVTVTDFNSCMATVCVTLTEPNPLTLILVGSDLSCFESNNGSIGAVVSGGTQDFSFLWSNGGTNQNIDLLEAGTFSLAVSDANSCLTTGETTLYQPPQIIVDAGNDITINAGEITTIAATSGFVSYLWSNGETDLSMDISDEGSYIVTVTDFMGCEGIDSMYLTLNPYIVQVLVLNSSWSMFSLNVLPPDPDISVVFADVANHVAIAKNSIGQSWWPLFSLNQIGDIIVDEGYLLNMSVADTLYVEGLIVVPETTPVTIPIEWSYMAYLRQTPGDVVEMLSPIVGSISLVKNDQGQMYWPYFGFNLIGDMLPGEGYQIKMISPDTLYYPPNMVNSAKTYVYNPRPEKYQIDINTANNMTLGIPETAWANMPDEGDEIGIFNQQGELAGAAVFTGGHTAISIWGDDQLTERKELFVQGDKFEIRLWDTNSETEEVLVVASWTEGSTNFAENGIAIVDKFASTEIQESETSLNQNYPNPFNSETLISFSLSEESLVRISLFNALGEEVADICRSHFNAGEHQLAFDGSKLPSGIYMYRMETKNNSHVRQMNILH